MSNYPTINTCLRVTSDSFWQVFVRFFPNCWKSGKKIRFIWDAFRFFAILSDSFGACRNPCVSLGDSLRFYGKIIDSFRYLWIIFVLLQDLRGCCDPLEPIQFKIKVTNFKENSLQHWNQLCSSNWICLWFSFEFHWKNVCRWRDSNATVKIIHNQSDMK